MKSVIPCFHFSYYKAAPWVQTTHPSKGQDRSEFKHVAQSPSHPDRQSSVNMKSNPKQDLMCDTFSLACQHFPGNNNENVCQMVILNQMSLPTDPYILACLLMNLTKKKTIYVDLIWTGSGVTSGGPVCPQITCQANKFNKKTSSTIKQTMQLKLSENDKWKSLWTDHM